MNSLHPHNSLNMSQSQMILDLTQKRYSPINLTIIHWFEYSQTRCIASILYSMLQMHLPLYAVRWLCPSLTQSGPDFSASERAIVLWKYYNNMLHGQGHFRFGVHRLWIENSAFDEWHGWSGVIWIALSSDAWKWAYEGRSSNYLKALSLWSKVVPLSVGVWRQKGRAQETISKSISM